MPSSTSNLLCSKCGAVVSDQDNYCEECGNSLRPTREPPPQDLIEKAKEWPCIQWLAQCERRLSFPLDRSEASAFVSVEYAWKALNFMYRPQRKLAKGPEIEAVKTFVCSTVNGKWFLEEMGQYCRTLRDNIEINRQAQPSQLIPIMEQFAAEKEENFDAWSASLDGSDGSKMASETAAFVYQIRNARVHGESSADSFNATEKDWKDITRVAEILGRLVIHLFSNFQTQKQSDIEWVIEMRVMELMRAIQKEAAKWPQDDANLRSLLGKKMRLR